MTKDQKIKIAKRLNDEYAKGGVKDRESWSKVIDECRSAGINEDLIQVSPYVFDLLIKSKVIEKYFYEPVNK